MRLVHTLRTLRGYGLAALLLLVIPTARLVAQGEAASRTMRNASGSFMQVFLEVALPVALVIAAIYLVVRMRRQRR